MGRMVDFLAATLIALCASASAQDGDAVRVTVTINPDGSKTVLRNDPAQNRLVALTTSASGKPAGKTVYKLDSEGRYETGQVFAADGSFRFNTVYKYDSAGRLAEERQLAKDDSLLHRIVYSYDANGHSLGYAIYDSGGHLLGRTTARKPAERPSSSKSR